MAQAKSKTKKQTEKNDNIPVVDVYSLSGKKVDKLRLNPGVFNAEIRKPLLHQVII